MCRTAVLAGSVAIALATGGVLAVTGGAEAPSGTTLQFITKDNGLFKFVDAPPKAKGEEDASSGDSFLISTPVYSTSNKRVGTLDAHCSFTRGGSRMRGVCTGIYDLPGGENPASARLSADDDTAGAVVGGTGAYVGARGTFKSVDRPGRAGGDPSDETFTLLP